MNNENKRITTIFLEVRAKSLEAIVTAILRLNCHEAKKTKQRK